MKALKHEGRSSVSHSQQAQRWEDFRITTEPSHAGRIAR